jgi:hypothetical protein
VFLSISDPPHEILPTASVFPGIEDMLDQEFFKPIFCQYRFGFRQYTARKKRQVVGHMQLKF